MRRALDEDLLPLGDLTATLVDPSRRASMAVVARRTGVLAGSLCAREAFSQVDPGIEIEWVLPDGSSLRAGTTVGTVRGPMRALLTAERTALNFLCHLSGVASATRRVVDAVTAANPDTRVLDTRKTTPGLRALEKAAVRAGGGFNHRGSLSDGILVKDNHLGGILVRDAVTAALARFPGRFVEVECDEPGQAKEAAAAGAHAVLLDNMTPDEVAQTVASLRASGSSVLVEVSGGVTESTAPDYARAGADFVSLGALTHSAPALDLGLDLVAPGAL